MKHIKLLLLLSLSLSTFHSLYAQSEQQIESILSRMTLDEKIAIIHAQSKFSSPGVPRLGIPGLWCSDGPHGVRAEVLWDEWNQAGWTSDSCVAFPALTCLAATWNPQISRLYGENLAEEALYRGKNVMLGPGVNIFRTSMNLNRGFGALHSDEHYAAARQIADEGIVLLKNRRQATGYRLQATGDRLEVMVTNTGAVAGAEVVQVYVGEKKPTVARPIKELKAFRKVYLEPGESKTVTFELNPDEWGYWDEAEHRFVTNKGQYTIFIGSSSLNIRGKKTVFL